jgi:outer membrane protein assembly factor BamB
MKRLLLPLFAVSLVAPSRPAVAEDWPQWRGPQRNGISKEAGLLKEWPKEGPKLLWEVKDIGNGYSTPSVVGDRIYLMSNRGDEESVLALDVKNGKTAWSTPVGKVGENRGPQYPGTRSTPTVDGDVLYALGSDGDLVCLETAEGKLRWKKNLKADFQGRPGNWAYAESPLIDGGVLVCTPGGSEATLVALDKKDGSVIWKSAVPGGDAAAYASPIIARVDGAKEYVQFLGKGVVGVDARTGRFLWRYARTAQGSPANIPTPVFHDSLVFSSTGRGGGGVARLTPEKEGVSAAEVYLRRELANPIGGVVRVGDYLYGTNTQSLFCVAFATGKVRWQNRCVGQGSICYADGRLYVRGENTGDVALVEATPDDYKERGRLHQPDRSRQKAWPYPVVANGRLYLRDQNVLLCYDVKDPAAKK